MLKYIVLYFVSLNFLHAEVVNDSIKENQKIVSISYFFQVEKNISSLGHEQDAETGYNARNARWQDADMLGFGQIDPMSDKYPSLSPYNYCNNNPILFSDPTGEDPDADRDGEIGDRAQHNDGKYYSMTEKGWGGTTQNEAIVNSKKTNIGIPTDVAKIMETSDGAMYQSGSGYIWENYAKSVGQTNDYYIHQDGKWNYYQNYGNWNDRMWQGKVDMWESWANVMAQACVSMIPVSGVASSTFSKTVVMNAPKGGGLNLFKWGAEQTGKSTGWKIGDYMLHLPNKGTPKLNWRANFQALRREMGLGKPIYDSYRLPNGNLIPTNGFLNAERFTLESRGWIYNRFQGAWLPPIK